MLRVLLRALLACTPLVVGCAAPSLHYAGSARASYVDEARRETLVAMVTPVLAAEKIAQLEFVAGDERIVRVRSPEGVLTLEGVPAAALQAARIVLDAQFHGAELDVLMAGAGPGEPPRMWSVTRDLEGRIVVRRGEPPRRLDGPDPSAEELAQRFAIGPLLGSADVEWSPDERRALAQALDLLKPTELALLHALPFERQHIGPDPRHAGLYVRSTVAKGGKIVLFDLAFTDTDSYVGQPDRAYPYSVYVILHEIGHAIAKLYRERVLLQYQKDVETYNELVTRVNRSVDEYRLGEQAILAGAPMKSSERRALDERQRALSEEISRVKRLLSSARRQLRKMEKITSGPTPMEQLYSQLPRALDGPTLYGRTDVSESFAESFALFHVHPDSLQRISPDVQAWFASGAHLELSDGPAEEADGSMAIGP
jgi:hypothetical protein